MTAPIDSEVVEARLRELARRLRRIEAKKPRSARKLAADEDLQDILSRNLELAIQACVDVAAHVCGAHGVPSAFATCWLTSTRKWIGKSSCA